MDRVRHRTPRIANKAEIMKATSNIKLNEAEKSAVFHLKKLYLETLKVDVEMQRQMYKVDKSFEPKYNKIYDERKMLLDECKNRTAGDANKSDLSIFWLMVLKSSYSELICERDEAILVYLSDIRSVLHDDCDDTVYFVLEFFFDSNPYFTDRVLTKTYYMNYVPNMEDPYRFTGADIVKCEGCDIHWKEGHKPKSEFLDSLFAFFTPPKMPGLGDRNYDEIHRFLRNDYELGFYLKECVIPKAVLYYTGEMSDSINSVEELVEIYEEEETDDDSDEHVNNYDEEEGDKYGDNDSGSGSGSA